MPTGHLLTIWFSAHKLILVSFCKYYRISRSFIFHQLQRNWKICKLMDQWVYWRLTITISTKITKISKMWTQRLTIIKEVRKNLRLWARSRRNRPIVRMEKNNKIFMRGLDICNQAATLELLLQTGSSLFSFFIVDASDNTNEEIAPLSFWWSMLHWSRIE